MTGDEYGNDMGLLGSGLYAASFAVALIVTLGIGAPFDRSTLILLGATGGSAVAVPFLPWRRHATLILWGTSFGTLSVVVVSSPALLRSPALATLPILAGLWNGMGMPRWWVVTAPLPYTVIVATADPLDAVVTGWAEAVGLYGVTVTIGLGAAWLRRRVETAAAALLDQQRTVAEQAGLELAERVRSQRETRRIVDLVSTSSQAVHEQIANVSASLQELKYTVDDTTASSQRVHDSADNAVGAAEQSRRSISSLDESGRAISTVVEVITALSNQINLLALNATIEAARAGEAGRGFAVVAGQVKELADRTAGSASSIGDLVSEVHDQVSGSATAICEIADLVAGLRDQQEDLNRTIGEQSRAVDEIAAAMAVGATGVTSIVEAIGQLEAGTRSFPDT